MNLLVKPCQNRLFNQLDQKYDTNQKECQDRQMLPTWIEASTKPKKQMQKETNKRTHVKQKGTHVHVATNVPQNPGLHLAHLLHPCKTRAVPRWYTSCTLQQTCRTRYRMQRTCQPVPCPVCKERAMRGFAWTTLWGTSGFVSIA